MQEQWKLICLICFGVFAVMLGNAMAVDQWISISPSPTSKFIHDVWSPDGGETSYFVGDGGLILRKSGNTFTIMDSGTLVPLRGIHGTSATDIWAVGGDSMAETPQEKSVILHYDGTNWTSRGLLSLYASPEMSSTYEARGVYAADSSNVWIAGWGTYPWRWTGGNNWVQENVTVDYTAFPDMQYGQLHSIFGFSENDIYAVGDYGTVLHKDATGWSVQRQFETEAGSGPYYMSFNLLQDVWGPDEDHVFACGNSGQVYLLDQTQISPAWTKINEGGFIVTAYDLAKMDGSGPDDVWFVGAGGVLRRWHGYGTPEGLDVFDTTPMKYRQALLATADGKYLMGGENGLVETLTPSTQALVTLNTPAKVSVPFQYAGWTGRLWLVPKTTDADRGIYTWDQGKMTSHTIPGLVSGQVTAFGAFSAEDLWIVSSDFATNSVKRFDGSGWRDWQQPGYFGQPIIGIAKSPQGQYAVLSGSTWAQGSDTSGGNPCIVGTTELHCLEAMQTGSTYYSSIGSDAAGSFYAVGAKVEESSAGAGDWTVVGGRVVSGQGSSWAVPVDLGVDELRAVAAGNGYVVVVGENRAAYYSQNGGAWQQIQGISRRPPISDTPLETFVNVIHAGNGVFYALSNTNSHWTDGGKGYLWRIENGQGTVVEGGYSGELFGLSTDPSQNATFVTGSAGVVLTNLPGFQESLPVRQALPGVLLLLLNGKDEK